MTDTLTRDLLRLILAGNIQGIVEATFALNEAQRASQQSSIMLLKSQLEKIVLLPNETKTRWAILRALNTHFGHYTLYGSFELAAPERIGLAIEAATVACADLKANHPKNLLPLSGINVKSVLKGVFVQREAHQGEKEMLLHILARRSPPWLFQWIESYVFTKRTSLYYWDDFWALTQQGSVARPITSSYIQFMVEELPDEWFFNEEYRPLSQVIQKYPKLLEMDIWKIFTTDNTALKSDNFILHESDNEAGIPIDKYEDWPMMLINLSKQGVISRHQLIHHTLLGLSIPSLKSTTYSYLKKFYNLLNITEEEKISQQHSIFRIIERSPSVNTTFALNEALSISSAESFDHNEYLGLMVNHIISFSSHQAKKSIKTLSNIFYNLPHLTKEYFEKLYPKFSQLGRDIRELIFYSFSKVDELQEYFVRIHHDDNPTYRFERQHKKNNLKIYQTTAHKEYITLSTKIR